MNGKFYTQDLVMLLVEKQGVDKKRAEVFVKEFFLLIEEGLEKDKYVKVKGLGTFKLIEVESRESVDVNTGERIEIKGHTKVSFTPEPALKEIINRPFSHFESVVLNNHVVFDDVPNEEDEDLPQNQEGKLEQTQDESYEQVAIEVKSDVESDPENAGIVPDSSQIPDMESEAETEAISEAETEEDALLEVQADVVTNVKANAEDGTDFEFETATAEEPDGESVVAEDAQKRPIAYYFQWFLIAVMILCLGSILAMYWDDLKVFSSDTVVVEENYIVDMSVENDSLSKLNPDTVGTIHSGRIPLEEALPLSEAMQKVKTESENASKPVEPVNKQGTMLSQSKDNKRLAAKSFTPDSTGYAIVGTEESYTIKEGETLTKVALKFYGTKALWPYIVKHNPSVIVNPDNVPFGTIIKIPKLKKKQ